MTETPGELLREDDAADDLFQPEVVEASLPGTRSRRVVTQPFDLSVHTIIEQIEGGSLMLASDFQRNYVWDDAKASRLIESLLLNIPIPVCYFSEDQAGIYEVVDGHQRLQSIYRYVRGDFALRDLASLTDLKGLRFLRLPSGTQRDLTMRRTIRCVVITRESDPDLKFEIFERLNTNAVPLNAQELRNCVYRGDLNNLLRELVVDPRLRMALGRPDPDKRMRDHELILRFFALRARLSTYAPSLKAFLNRYQDDHRQMTPVTIEEHRAAFGNAIAGAAGVFGAAAFRRINAQGQRLEDSINRALFDAEMLCCDRVPADQAIANADQLKAGLAGLLRTDAFVDAIYLATSDKTRLAARVRAVAEVFSESGLPVSFESELQGF
jgi:hypothetical protein